MTPTPLTPDQLAAHQLLTELRTRIATQALPYQHGVESRALGSLREVFDHARAAMKNNVGCHAFADLVDPVLNQKLRPLTAKWHPQLESGVLNSRDGGDAFRGELAAVQVELRKLADDLHKMAYGKDSNYASPTSYEVISNAELNRLFDHVTYGIPALSGVSAVQASKMTGDEAGEIQERRRKLALPTAVPKEDGKPEPDLGNAIGLALSGGGIRSATFGLGVVQVLAERGLLKEVDVLSTVSGGGYTGSFMTRRLGESNATQAAVAGPLGPDTEPVTYLRRNAKFLAARNLKESWGMVVATFAGMLLNWTAPLATVLALAWLAAHVLGWGGHLLPVLAGIGVLISGGALLVYAKRMKQGREATLPAGKALGLAAAVTAFLLVLWGIETGYDRLTDWAKENWGKSAGLGALMGSIAALVPSVVTFVPVLKNPTVRKLLLKVLLILAGLLVPVAGLLIYYAGRGLAEAPMSCVAPAWNPLHYMPGHWVLLLLVLILAGVAFFLLNINLTGPHRLYRDGLARTFVQTAEDSSPVAPLATINPDQTAPYHLINTALNVPSSAHAALRDRRCDFFLFSKFWTGSPSTGYLRTGDWRMNGEPVDLGSAMAISGAAFSSHMGLGAMPTLQSLLVLLNVRLGFWIRHPDKGGKADKSSSGAHPGFVCLMREMMGVKMTEKASWLNLSDGGHIENMALYELLRRRCKFILCVDGEADPAFTFHGLMTVTRHAQIDFGVRIESDLDDLRPDPVTGLSRAHFHMSRVHYPQAGSLPAATGLLVYVKLSVTGNESELIRRYRITHPEFPHQSTIDQFFDQEQFEAYRQLGVHAAEGLFLPALMGGQGNSRPANFSEWYRRLAASVLEPT